MDTKSVKHSILESLDGDDARLFSYLPYLLQDVWEIGTSPQRLVELIETHNLV